MFLPKSNAETENFTNVYVFGDSFSVSGSLTSSLSTDMFEPLSWSGYLSKRYGKRDLSYFSFGSEANNFAQNGAPSAALSAQIDTYKNAKGNFDKNALYAIYMGPNDYASTEFQFAFQVRDRVYGRDIPINSLNTPNVWRVLNKITTNVANAAKSLSEDGAQFILVFNHINEGDRQVPQPLYPLVAVSESNLAKPWSNLLAENLKKIAKDANVILVDLLKLGEEAVKEPNKFFPLGGSFYLNAHPTYESSKLIAQLVGSVIEAPTRVSLARELPISLGDIYSDKLAISEYKNNFANKSSGDYNFYVDGDFAREETKTFSFKKLGYKNEINNFTTGASRTFYDDAVVGVGLNASRNSTKFKEETGKMDIESLGGFVYGGKDIIHSVRAFASAGLSNLKYKLKRNVQLGLLNRNHEGNTKGSHMYFNLGVKRGFEFNQSTNITPLAMLSYQTVSMKDFKESGDVQSTTMSYSIPKRKSLKSKLGAVLSKEFGFDSFVASPYLSAMWVHEFEDVFKDRAKGKNSDFDFNYFSVPTYKAKKDYIKLDLGLKANLYNMIDIKVQYGTEMGVKQTKSNHLANAGINIYM